MTSLKQNYSGPTGAQPEISRVGVNSMARNLSPQAPHPTPALQQTHINNIPSIGSRTMANNDRPAKESKRKAEENLNDEDSKKCKTESGVSLELDPELELGLELVHQLETMADDDEDTQPLSLGEEAPDTVQSEGEDTAVRSMISSESEQAFVAARTGDLTALEVYCSVVDDGDSSNMVDRLLLTATLYSQPAAVELLLLKGANPNAKNTVKIEMEVPLDPSQVQDVSSMEAVSAVLVMKPGSRKSKQILRLLRSNGLEFR